MTIYFAITCIQSCEYFVKPGPPVYRHNEWPVLLFTRELQVIIFWFLNVLCDSSLTEYWVAVGNDLSQDISFCFYS